MSLTHTIQVDEDNERELKVTWYKLLPSDPGGKYSPPCAAQLEELEARWVDTKQSLSDEEWDKFITPNWSELEDLVCEHDKEIGR
jgi:hypothetical protein